MKGILGKKLGMTQVFMTNGKQIPVTVIQVESNVITSIKTKENDGYNAVQLSAFDKSKKNTTKPLQGHFQKAKASPKRFVKEIRNFEIQDAKLGDKVTSNIFEVGQLVDITGISKGKGFQGPIKRHGFSRGPETHGSRHHRKTGSIGNVQQGRVRKGKKMPGHMGAEQITMQNLILVSIIESQNLILVKGNVPGTNGNFVIIKDSIKLPSKRFEVNLLNFTFDKAKEVETNEVKNEDVNVETPAQEVSTEAAEN